MFLSVSFKIFSYILMRKCREIRVIVLQFDTVSTLAWQCPVIEQSVFWLYPVIDTNTNRPTCQQFRHYRVIQEGMLIVSEQVASVIVRKENSYEPVYNSEWLPKLSCLNVQMQKHC
jgi:hypothetical protein